MRKAHWQVIDAAPSAGQVPGAAPTIVPDYELPAALMVPHCGKDAMLSLLEDIAAAASARIGVILLSDNPRRTQTFVDGQPAPAHFSILGATYDTPWIRDRAPFAVRRDGQVEWVLPKLPPGKRRLDAALFSNISVRPAQHAELTLAQGNLVAGPHGVAMSTDRVLRENGLSDARQLAAYAPRLGVRRWLVFKPFPDEPTRHADVHVRFLRPDLFAVGWSDSDSAVQERARDIEDGVKAVAPDARSLRIPIAIDGNRYASLLNWIQVGADLLVPTYELTSEKSLGQAQEMLSAAGFRVHPIFSPTLDYGGSLHCLTASVFV